MPRWGEGIMIVIVCVHICKPIVTISPQWLKYFSTIVEKCNEN